MPLRVLYLTPDLFGPPSGIARYCRMVCRSLLTQGHRVSVVSLLDRPSARREARAMFSRLRYLPCNGRKREFLWRSFSRALQMRPDVIFVGHPSFTPIGRVLRKLTGAKVVNFIYGVDAWQPLSPSRQRALNAGDLIVSISRFTARRASEENGVPSAKVRILHNGLDPHFQPRETAPAELGAPPSLLTVARISLQERYKGHDVVIRALPALLERFPDLRYNIVGSGDGKSILQDLAWECGVAGAVHFVGVVSEEELIEHYSRATVFVMPSRFEGFGFVFLEAMTYGKPVVCGNEDASVEVVRDGETGFTVDPSSPEAVGGAIARLLADRAACSRMGETGRKHVAQKFGFPGFDTQLRAILAEAMNGS